VPTLGCECRPWQAVQRRRRSGVSQAVRGAKSKVFRGTHTSTTPASRSCSAHCFHSLLLVLGENLQRVPVPGYPPFHPSRRVEASAMWRQHLQAYQGLEVSGGSRSPGEGPCIGEVSCPDIPGPCAAQHRAVRTQARLILRTQLRWQGGHSASHPALAAARVRHIAAALRRLRVLAAVTTPATA
jgi:hypothetical protein